MGIGRNRHRKRLPPGFQRLINDSHLVQQPGHISGVSSQLQGGYRWATGGVWLACFRLLQKSGKESQVGNVQPPITSVRDILVLKSYRHRLRHATRLRHRPQPAPVRSSKPCDSILPLISTRLPTPILSLNSTSLSYDSTSLVPRHRFLGMSTSNGFDIQLLRDADSTSPCQSLFKPGLQFWRPRFHVRFGMLRFRPSVHGHPGRASAVSISDTSLW
ncbi:hypothetical protein ACFE04_004239 [Oxalis oulophora]